MLAALAAPTPTGPSGTVSAATVSTKPTFSWNSVPGAAQYRLYLVDATMGQLVLDNASVVGSAFTITTPLTRGHRYTWYVGAEGTLGASGAVSWSSAVNFTLTA